MKACDGKHKGGLRRKWSITTQVEENIKCDVTLKVNLPAGCFHLNVLSAYEFMLAAFYFVIRLSTVLRYISVKQKFF